ncbi:hypothetical protein [Bacillus safensis]|uniref:hypothetical protein n=1 Tax=Bacillus safensis TaxID=561879 RepID=UPI00041DD51A|nr:hypothetical protein [Bacillus safensis]
MGFEYGSLFVHDRKLWFFEGYSTNEEMYQTLKLRGVGGVQVEALASECYFLGAPSEFDYEEIEQNARRGG